MIRLIRAVGLAVVAAIFFAGCGATVGTPQAGESAPPAGVPSQVTAANEIAVMARLHAIASAEAQYFAQSASYTTLDDLVSKQFLTDTSKGKFQGYQIEVQLKPDGFAATAAPNKYGVTGKRSFYLDQTNVLRGADKAGAQATASDPQQ